MSVVKLQLITVTGAPDALAPLAARAACEPDFIPERAADAVRSAVSCTPADGGDPCAALLEQARTLADKLHLTLPETAKEGEESAEQIAASLDALAARESALCAQTAATEERVRDIRVLLEQLSHMTGLEVPLDDLFRLKHFKLRFGKLPREHYEALSMYPAEADEYFFFVSTKEKNEVWGLYITPVAACERVDALFERLSFERLIISERAHGTPQDASESLRGELADAEKSLTALADERTRFASEAAEQLSGLYARLLYLDRCVQVRSAASYTDGGFILCGYAPKKQAQAIAKRLCGAPGVSVTVADPAPDAPKPPPTIIKNPWFFRPFEEYVKMYGLPCYTELDPTPLVALSYMLFFGVMFGDVGQGALIIAAGALMWFAKKMFIGRILTRVGISSILFGLLYGSVFGYEDVLPFGFKVNEGNNMNITLIGAVAVGAVMVSLCMFMNIANGVRQKDAGKMLFSGNGVAALVFYWSVLVLVLGMLNFLPVAVPLAVLGVLIGLSLLLILMHEPLASLIARRKKLVPAGWVDYLLESFFELFETVLSFVTNTISYIRLGAFALSHVGMMSVVFLLASNGAGGYNPIVVILGNVFVTGFEGMIVCIQALRLEYYELFSRFYTGDGRAIKEK